MSVYQPIKLEILIVITERIDELLSHFQQSHVEEELEDCVDGYVEVNVQRYTTTGHSLSRIIFDLLSANDSEDEEEVGGEGDDLCVDHGDGDPIVAPE